MDATRSDALVPTMLQAKPEAVKVIGPCEVLAGMMTDHEAGFGFALLVSQERYNAGTMSVEDIAQWLRMVMEFGAMTFGAAKCAAAVVLNDAQGEVDTDDMPGIPVTGVN